jgi:hypothetical protein
LLPSGSAHEIKRIGYLEAEAYALYRQRKRFGDNAALSSAIERYKRPVRRIPAPKAVLREAAFV